MDGINDHIEIIRDLRDQDHVRAGSQAGAHGQPAGAVAEQLHQHNAMRGVGVGVQAVDRLGGDFAGGVKTDRFVGKGHIVFAGFWHGDNIQSCLAEMRRRKLALVVANDNQRVKLVAVVAIDRFLGAVDQPLRAGHALGQVTAGAQDCATLGEDTREHIAFQQVYLAVLDQAQVSIAEAKHFHVVCVCHCFPKTANGSVDARAVAACCD